MNTCTNELLYNFKVKTSQKHKYVRLWNLQKQKNKILFEFYPIIHSLFAFPNNSTSYTNPKVNQNSSTFRNHRYDSLCSTIIPHKYPHCNPMQWPNQLIQSKISRGIVAKYEILNQNALWFRGWSCNKNLIKLMPSLNCSYPLSVVYIYDV